MFLSLIRFALPQPALWKTLLRFDAKNGAVSGETVSELEDPLDILGVGAAMGEFFNAVLVADVGQGAACAVPPCPSLGTKSIAIAQ